VFAVRTRKDLVRPRTGAKNLLVRPRIGAKIRQPGHKVPSHACSNPYMTPKFLRIILQVSPFCKTSGQLQQQAANYFRHATTCSILHQIATAQHSVRSAPTSTIYPRPTRRSYLPCFLAALFILQIISSRRRRALQLFHSATSQPLGRRIIGAR
jgi:hypothetical protein